MSDTPSDSAGKSIMPSWIKCPQDFVGGLVLCAVAIFALWASATCKACTDSPSAPAPRRACSPSCCWALALPWRWWASSPKGPAVAHYSWRGPLFVMAGIVFFAFAIRPLGLIVSGLATFLISALGSDETRWVEAIIVGVCLTIGCAFLFPYVLGLPMPLFPRFLVQ